MLKCIFFLSILLPTLCYADCNKAPAPEEGGFFSIFKRREPDPKFLASSSIVPSNDPRIIALAREITKNAVCDSEKVLRIHNWIAENIVYDMNVLGPGNEKNFSLSLDALATLQRKKGACVGVSTLTAALLRAVGIGSKIIRGFANGNSTSAAQVKYEYENWDRIANFNAGSHVWNKVYFDGAWHIVDVTFDLAVFNDGTVSMLYFQPQKDFFEITHYELHEDEY